MGIISGKLLKTETDIPEKHAQTLTPVGTDRLRTTKPRKKGYGPGFCKQVKEL